MYPVPPLEQIACIGSYNLRIFVIQSFTKNNLMWLCCPRNTQINTGKLKTGILRVIKTTFLKIKWVSSWKEAKEKEKMASRHGVHEKRITRGLSSSNLRISDNHSSMCAKTEVGSKEEHALSLLRTTLKETEINYHLSNNFYVPVIWHLLSHFILIESIRDI